MNLVRIQQSEHKLNDRSFGRGLFTIRSVRANEPLFMLEGPTIDFAEACAMDDEESYALQCDSNIYISLTEPACFINHSCEPNAGIRGLTMVALRLIAEDEEVTFDYSTTMDEGYWTMVCNCKSPICRGVIKDFRTLEPDLKSVYLDLEIVMPFIASQYKTVRSTT